MPWSWLIAPLIALAVLAPWGMAQADYRIGVVLSQTGPYAATGRLEQAALEAVLSELTARAPDFARRIDLQVRDDTGNPLLAERLARSLIDEGVHLLVCCSSEAAARRVTAVAAAAEVLTLSSTTAAAQRGTVWHFALGSGEETLLRAVVRHAFASGKLGLGLMTIDNAFGLSAREVLEREMGVAGMELRGYAAYAVDRRPLTPEALWVATREPGAVLVWGLRSDSLAAVAALRGRGFTGPIYLRPAVIAGAADDADLSALDGVLVPLSPLELRADLSDEHPSARAVAAMVRQFAPRYGREYLTNESAVMVDLMSLALLGLEQATQYGVAASDLQRFRQALRDATVGLPPYPGAAGIFDLSERRTEAALPAGLVMAEVVSGQLQASLAP